MFLDHLTACITKKDSSGTHRATLQALLACLDEETISQLSLVVPNVGLDEVARVAASAPTRFRSLVVATRDQNNPERQQEARRILTEAMQPRPVASPATAAILNANAKEAPSPPQMELPIAKRTTDSANPVAGRKYQSTHVYGASYALCFNLATRDGQPGVMIDAANRTNDIINWQDAIHFWLVPSEIAACIAVFRRWRPGISFEGHGKRKDKAFSLEAQNSHFFAKVLCKSAKPNPVRAVPIGAIDAIPVAMLFMQSLKQCYPEIPMEEILETIRAVHQVGATANA